MSYFVIVVVMNIGHVHLKSKVKGQHDNGCNGRVGKDKLVRLYENLAFPRVEPHHSTGRNDVIETDSVTRRLTPPQPPEMTDPIIGSVSSRPESFSRHRVRRAFELFYPRL